MRLARFPRAFVLSRLALITGTAVAAGAVPAAASTTISPHPPARTATPAAVTAPSNWPQFHHGPARSGNNTAETSLGVSSVGTLKRKWAVTTPGAIYSSPAVVRGVIYVGTLGASVIALKASNGKQLWRFRTKRGVRSSPAVVGGVVYVASVDGTLYALKASTGKKLWSFNTGGFNIPSPAVVNGVVYYTLYREGTRASLPTTYALRASDGKKLWTAAHGSSGSSPAVANGTVYLKDFATVWALIAADGKLLWSADIGNTAGGSCPFSAAPAVVGKTVYVNAGGGGQAALNATTGQLTWGDTSDSSATEDCATPTVANGLVYDGGANLRAVSASTGEPVFYFNGHFFAYASPAVANGVVYQASDHGALYAVNATTGAPLWHATIPARANPSSPVVAGGVLYVGSASKQMFAFAPTR